MTDLYRVEFWKLEARGWMLEGFTTAIHGPGSFSRYGTLLASSPRPTAEARTLKTTNVSITITLCQGTFGRVLVRSERIPCCRRPSADSVLVPADNAGDASQEEGSFRRPDFPLDRR